MKILQSKKHSFIEAIVNTFIGFITTLVISPLLYYICNIKANLFQITEITILFTIISILRNYIIRRWFNKLK